MPGRQGDEQVLGEQLLDVQSVVPDRHGHDRHVEFAREDGGQKVVRPVLDEPQVDRRLVLEELRGDAGDQVRGDRGDGPDPEFGPRRPGPDGPLGVGHGRQNPLGRREQLVPGGGEDDLPPEPVEQADVQVRFEFQNLLGQGRLGYPLPLGRPGKPAGLGDRDEVADAVDLHWVILSSCGLGLLQAIISSRVSQSLLLSGPPLPLGERG